MSELDAARMVRAALRVIRDSFADCGALDATVARWQYEVGDVIEGLEASAPPWTAHEGYPERDLPWSEVATADYVRAPNGEWYEVDAWSRTGSAVAVMLKVGDALARSARPAGEKVRVRRGPNGQAIDVLHAAGLSTAVLNS